MDRKAMTSLYDVEPEITYKESYDYWKLQHEIWAQGTYIIIEGVAQTEEEISKMWDFHCLDRTINLN